MGWFSGDRAKTTDQSDAERQAAQQKALTLYPGAQSNVDGGVPIVEVIHTRNDTLFRIKLNPWVEALLSPYEVFPQSGLHTVGEHIKITNGKSR